MATFERDVVLQGKTQDGKTTIDLPITALKNIEDTAEVKEKPDAGDYIPVIDTSDNGQMKKVLFSTVGGLAAEVQADLDMHAQNGNNPHGVTAEQAGAVPTTRTVNGKALTSDISLSAADVDAYSKAEMDTAIDNLANQRNYSYGTEDMTAGESVLETGKLYFVYE